MLSLNVYNALQCLLGVTGILWRKEHEEWASNFRSFNLGGDDKSINQSFDFGVTYNSGVS